MLLEKCPDAGPPTCLSDFLHLLRCSSHGAPQSALHTVSNLSEQTVLVSLTARPLTNCLLPAADCPPTCDVSPFCMCAYTYPPGSVNSQDLPQFIVLV